jgi:hypothetical protein
MADMSASFPRRPEHSGFPMRDLALVAYFARWQSVARYQLAASDSETLSLVEHALRSPGSFGAGRGLRIGADRARFARIVLRGDSKRIVLASSVKSGVILRLWAHVGLQHCCPNR